MEPNTVTSVLHPDSNGNGRGASSPEMADVSLVRRTKAGDVSAFEELFRRYQKRVYNMAYRLVGNESDASELTQEVFVKVFNSIGRLRAEEAFLTWLRTVTVNVCRDFGRRKKPNTESLDATVKFEDGEVSREIADPSIGPEKQLLLDDKQQAIRRAVSTLSPEHRTVIVLHHLEGMDVSEIAKMLDSPIGTVKSRLSRAREELKRKLSHYVD